MRPNTCIHFNGMACDTCKAGINYLDVAAPLSQDNIEFHKKNYPNTGQNRIGIVKRIPCHRENNISTCSNFKLPTRAELEQFDAEINMAMKNVAIARAVIVNYLKLINKLNSNYTDHIPCPICGSGELNFRIAGAYNGHIHAQCTNPKCVQWME